GCGARVHVQPGTGQPETEDREQRHDRRKGQHEDGHLHRHRAPIRGLACAAAGGRPPAAMWSDVDGHTVRPLSARWRKGSEFPARAAALFTPHAGLLWFAVRSDVADAVEIAE